MSLADEPPPLTWMEKMAINTIKAGQVPRHVAFIMDGNRRYATQANIPIKEGHTKGFEKMGEAIRWCMELGIKELTVFAFAVANFNRSKEEVDGLMQICKEKFQELLDRQDEFMKYGICIRIMGNLSYLSPEIKEILARIEFLTENNTKINVNLAASYSSQDEITHSIKSITEGVHAGLLEPQDINEQLISDCMFISKSPDPDMLIRTSGEIRLSDFMLWQTTCTQIYFTNSDILWPTITIWNFLAAIFKYQTNYNYTLSVKKAKASLNDQCTQNNQRVEKFLNYLQQCRRKEFESYITVK